MDILSALQSYKAKLCDISYEQLTTELDVLLPSVPFNVIDFKNKKFELNQREMGGTNVVYRARINNSVDKNPYQNIGEISYIKEEDKQLITEFGRVNKPEQPMFYGSTNYHTACVECFSKGNNFQIIKERGSLRLTVGVWKINSPLTLVNMLYSEKNFEKFGREMQELNHTKISIDDVRAMNEDLQKKIGDKNAYDILRFFSDEFADFDYTENYEYKLCNYFADRVFDRNDKFKVAQEGKVDGIMFPSVSSFYHYDNLVFTPDIVDEKLEFFSAMHVWVTYSEKGELSFITLKQHVRAENGILTW